MIHELFSLTENIMLNYVLLHEYPLDIQSKKKLLWLMRKKKHSLIDNGEYNIESV